MFKGRVPQRVLLPAEKELWESVCEVHDGPSGEEDGVARQEGLLATEAVRQEAAGHEAAHAEQLHDAHCGTNDERRLFKGSEINFFFFQRS